MSLVDPQMSYGKCKSTRPMPSVDEGALNQTRIEVFGESHIDEIAASLNVPVLGKMPIDPAYAAKVDEGAFDEIDNPYIEAAEAVMPQ